MTFTNDHCNNPDCNQRIRWINPFTGEPIYHPITGNKRPLNPDGTLHLCMKKGQKHYFPKREKGSRITDYANGN